MSAIKVLRSCGASGADLVVGTVHAVPDQVSKKDAAVLVQLGKAEYVEPAQPEGAAAKPKRGKKADA